MNSSGGETRTLNLAVNSRSLCRLSYPGRPPAHAWIRAGSWPGVPVDISRSITPPTVEDARSLAAGHNEAVKFRIGIAIAFCVGYILGAKAGRERYRSMVRIARQAGRSAPVNGTVELVGAKTRAVATLGIERLKDAIGVRLGWRDGDDAADAIATDLATALNGRRPIPSAAVGTRRIERTHDGTSRRRGLSHASSR